MILNLNNQYTTLCADSQGLSVRLNSPFKQPAIKIKPDGGGIEEGDIKWVINPYDEYAVEEALRLKEKKGGEVVIVTWRIEQDRIMRDIERRCASLSVPAAEAIVALSRKVTEDDAGDQILLLPHHFLKTLRIPYSGLARKLGAANLYGWIAYKIYDDIPRDEED